MTELSFDQSVQVPSHVVLRQLQDETVLLNLQSEMYFGLDAVGTRMWQVMTAESSLQAAYAVLLTEFEADPDSLRHDLREFVLKLAEADLLIVETRT